MEIELEVSWRNLLKDDINSPYFKNIISFLDKNRKINNIYPDNKDIFRAFNISLPNKTNVVLLGQDPYHQAKQATGLCFCVQKDSKPPPSLKNIFKEIDSDLGYMPTNPDLTRWANSGVLLLNSVLSVEEAKPNSHKDIGWQQFTNSVISKLSTQNRDTIFILWGEFAKSKKQFIQNSNYILEAPHPSPLSAYRGFFGCRHFSKTNNILRKLGKPLIDW